jgi:hypothetical protein
MLRGTPLRRGRSPILCRFTPAPELLARADIGTAFNVGDRYPAYSTRPNADEPKILSITSAP